MNTSTTNGQSTGWKMSTQTGEQIISKQPVLIKGLIEKAFEKLATRIMQRMQHLEEELTTLKSENQHLKVKLYSEESKK